jgi:SM-20-related protein
VSENELSLISSIVDDLQQQGYTIQPNALPKTLSGDLLSEIKTHTTGQMRQAGVGRQSQHAINTQIRSDKIHWIDERTQIGRDWLKWIDELRAALNRQLFMGLNYFESHFAHYSENAFYQRHRDAFVGQSNRVLSLVTYLNPDWREEDGGELVIYRNDNDKTGIRVKPQMGTLVLFLSEEFPHEVLSAKRDRHSIAGWFRRNQADKTVF